MLKKALAACAATATLLMLAACAPEVQSTVYLSDVFKVVTEGGTLTTAAVLRIPQGSEDECNEGLAGLIEKLTPLAPTTGKGKCIELKESWAAEIETSMLITRPGDTYPQPNLFVLEVSENGAGSDLTFHLLQPIAEITKALAGDSGISTDFDPSVFTFRIENDRDATVDLYPNHVFIDDEPGLTDGVSLERRAGATIRFSDVASVHVERGNSYSFASLGIMQ